MDYAVLRAAALLHLEHVLSACSTLAQQAGAISAKRTADNDTRTEDNDTRKNWNSCKTLPQSPQRLMYHDWRVCFVRQGMEARIRAPVPGAMGSYI